MEVEKKKVMFVGFEVMQAEDLFRKMGKSEEEIKEEMKRLIEDE